MGSNEEKNAVHGSSQGEGSHHRCTKKGGVDSPKNQQRSNSKDYEDNKKLDPPLRRTKRTNREAWNMKKETERRSKKGGKDESRALRVVGQGFLRTTNHFWPDPGKNQDKHRHPGKGSRYGGVKRYVGKKRRTVMKV